MTLPESWLVKASVSVDAVEASTWPVAAVVVQDTGGVSFFAIQLAALHGAEANVTTMSEEMMVRVKALGARHAINCVLHPDWH